MTDKQAIANLTEAFDQGLHIETRLRTALEKAEAERDRYKAALGELWVKWNNDEKPRGFERDGPVHLVLALTNHGIDPSDFDE